MLHLNNWVYGKLQVGSTAHQVSSQLYTVLVLLDASSESLDR